MIQKRIFFINNFIIILAIVFMFIFFIPMFTINFPLDYKIIKNNLIVDAGNINMKKDLFVKLENNTVIINHNTGSFKIDRHDVQGNQIILDIRQLNVSRENDLKVFYDFKKNVISYISKKVVQ
ncbi:hypothetical protein AGMMS50222_01650 [Endomicrobiia bacterium]|nr:hypothetical protein AGMMS49556_01510 [Endomicrobiia bacterium]GHT70553.1 hypothetical protein AGMMS49950_05730 [Endomicrobiia bacterium]GHT73706.1 hypothetical protein AGMMS50222_01650 [Endomicrobiia bacterium]